LIYCSYQQSHSHSSFKNTESLISTLQKLNLDNDDVFYTGLSNFRDVEKTTDQTSSEYWCNYALKIDKASRLLIRNCILQGYALNEKDNEEVAKLIEQLEALDAYETLFSKFYNEQSTHDKEQRNIKQNISKIDELINALAELKSTYEEKLTS
jgi:hypothetical protein